MNQITIRKIKKNDGEKLGKFLESLSSETEYFFHPYPLTMDSAFSFVQRKDIVCFVAEIEDEIAGYVWFEPINAEVPTIGICVRERYQGKGIGKKLMTRIIEEAKIYGKRGLKLTVMKGNYKAINFYKSFNFHIVGEIEDKWGSSWEMFLEIDQIE